jgi:putative colanic acid biosynthesis UDP-glucose lipid carrier transferase
VPTSYFKFSIASAVLAVLQSIAAPLISAVTLVAVTRILGARFGDAHIALALVSALLFYILMRGSFSTQYGVTISGWVIARQVTVAWIGVVAGLLLIAYATKVSAVFSRRVLFTWALLTPVILTGFLIILRQWLRLLVVRSGNVRSAVIAGVNDMSRQLSKRVAERPELGLNVVGFFDDRSAERVGGVDERSSAVRAVAPRARDSS